MVIGLEVFFFIEELGIGFEYRLIVWGFCWMLVMVMDNKDVICIIYIFMCFWLVLFFKVCVFICWSKKFIFIIVKIK